MDNIKEHLFIVIGEEHYNPLGVIRTLGENGIKPIYIAIKYKSTVASSSKYVLKNHFVNNFHEAYDLLIKEYGHDQKKKPFVITTDDDIQSLLDENYDTIKDKFIFFDAGANGKSTEFMDKKKILDLAQKHGLKVLNTIVVDRGVVPDGIEYPVITKSISPNIGGWKADVHICYSEEQLRNAYKTIKSPRVLIQKFLDKKNELCIEGYSADHGKKMFIPICTTYNYNIQGYYSPYMTVHEFTNQKLFTALNGMVAEIGFEGIFEIEFLIDKDDTLYFSEINFRNSTWSYAATKLGMPIPIMWAESMLSREIPKNAQKSIPDNYMAMVEPIDYGKRVETGKIELADWLMDFKNAGCLYYMSNDDPEPFREMVRNWKTLS